MDDALIPMPPPGHDVGRRRETGERVSPPKTTRQAKCPHCWTYSHRTIGVTRTLLSATNTVEVFKDHYKTLASGGRVLCSGSGMEAPDE